MINKMIIKRTFNKYGTFHREDGSAVEFEDGSYHYYVNGAHHRLDGPAIYDAATGINRYCHNGLRHRLDGPAVIWDAMKSGMWYINGKHVDKEIRKWASEMNINLENLTEDDKILISIVWSDYGLTD